MRLSCLPVSLFGAIVSGELPVGAWPAAACQLGLDAYDISILFVRDRTPRGLVKLRGELEAGGLPLGMIATYPDFSNPDTLARERELAYALADIAVASELGAEYVRLTAGQYYPGSNEEEVLGHILECFSACYEHAERWGVKLLWENHSKPGAWEQPDFNFHPRRLRKMLVMLRGTGIRLNYDIANAWALGFGVELFRECAEMIDTIHVNDLASAWPVRFSGIGRGIAPVLETLNEAVRLGFQGLVSVEEASMEGMAGVERYTGVVREYLSQIKRDSGC